MIRHNVTATCESKQHARSTEEWIGAGEENLGCLGSLKGLRKTGSGRPGSRPPHRATLAGTCKSVHLLSSGRVHESITIAWTVTNQGLSPVKAEQWQDAFYLSADSVLDERDVSLGGRNILFESPLEPGASYSRTHTATLPNAEPGSQFLLSATDNANQQPEADEDNVIAVPIEIAAPDVDLSLQDAAGPASAITGENVQVSWTVANVGTESASVGWSDAVYLSAEEHVEHDSIVLDTPSTTHGRVPGCCSVNNPSPLSPRAPPGDRPHLQPKRPGPEGRKEVARPVRAGKQGQQHPRRSEGPAHT